jgi:hypothetical protein
MANFELRAHRLITANKTIWTGEKSGSTNVTSSLSSLAHGKRSSTPIPILKRGTSHADRVGRSGVPRFPHRFALPSEDGDFSLQNIWRKVGSMLLHNLRINKLFSTGSVSCPSVQVGRNISMSFSAGNFDNSD